MGSSKGGEAENRYLTHFEVISSVVAADGGRCKVFVSQNDLDQNISIDSNTISIFHSDRESVNETLYSPA